MQPVNSSNVSLPSPIFPIVSSAVLGLSFVLGVPGNIAVLNLLVWHLKEDCFTLRLMLNLAVSDLLTLLPLPVWIWGLLNGWIFGSVACKMLSYVIYWCLYSSTLCVTLMSLQRYMQVMHPQTWAKLGARGQTFLLCGMWILSGALASYALVQRTAEYDGHQFYSCHLKYGSDTENIATSLWEILTLVICYSLLVYFYCRLHQGVSHTQFFSSNRLTKLITRIVVACFIFWIPIAINNFLVIISVFYKDNSLQTSTDYGSSIARALIFVNSCVNPFLYTFSFRDLKRHNSHVGHTEQNDV